MHPVGKTIRWIEKWMTSFMMGTTSSITMQSLGKIVQCAPAVGTKMWCLFFCYRQDAAKRQTAGIVLLAGQKSGFSPCRGDSLHRFGSIFAGPTGAWVRLAMQNFTSIGAEGWECGPQNIKNFHFLVKIRGDSLDRFRKFLGAFIRLTILR